MPDPLKRNETWMLLHHGPRPSTLLTLGAVLGALGPLLLTVGRGDEAWLCWLSSLLLIGAGLILSGSRPWLTAFALVPGILFLSQGISLGVVLAARLPAAARLYELLAVPKLLSLAVLAMLAVRQIDTRRRRRLAIVAVVTALKPLLRHVGALPDALATVLDPLLAVLLAWVLVHVAVVLRRLETAWALRRWQENNATFDDFNPTQQTP